MSGPGVRRRGLRLGLTGPRGRLLVGLALAAAVVFAGVWLVARIRPAGRREGPEVVRVVWAFEPPERGAIAATPLVDGDRVYAGVIRDNAFSPRGAVYCLDRETRRVLWTFDDAGRMLPMYSSPCLAGGRLYIGEGMHANYVCRLRCLDPAGGRQLWNFEAQSHIESSPRVASGKVFFGAGDDGLFCLDAESGVRLWHHHPAVHVDTTPALRGERLYAGGGVSLVYDLKEVFCLDTRTGSPVWRARTDLPVWGSPAVDGDRVIFGLGNGRLTRSASPPEKPAGAVLCVAAGTGEVLWRRDVGDAVFARAAVGGGHVYAGSRDGHCYCLDRRDGRECWRVDMGSAVVTRPALVGSRLYVAAVDGRVCCLDAEGGAIRWTFDVSAHTRARAVLLSSPVVVPESRDAGGQHRIYLGAELRGPANNAAVLYCLSEGS